jgi:hypothetical protein
MGLDRFLSMRRNLETERSMKVHALLNAQNPVEKELLERELVLIDAQISWLLETIEKQAS